MEVEARKWTYSEVGVATLREDFKLLLTLWTAARPPPFLWKASKSSGTREPSKGCGGVEEGSAGRL